MGGLPVVFLQPRLGTPCSTGRGRSCERLVLGLAMLAWLVPASPAHAQARCGDRPWVMFTFDGQPWPAKLHANLIADLRAALRLRGMDACPELPVPSLPPIAEMAFNLGGGERVLVSIDVHDNITNKRVGRDIALHAVATDARGLLLAQAADELLRASWVELSIPDAPAPVMQPPAAIVQVVRESQQPAGQPLYDSLGLRAAVESYTGGQTMFGGDAALQLWLSERLALGLVIGVRSALSSDALHGTVEASAWLTGAELAYAFLPRAARYNLLVGFGAYAGELSFSGRARGPAHPERRQGWFADGRVSLTGAMSLAEHLRLSVDLGPGLPFRSVEATDSGRDVTGTRGLELHAALGLGGLF
jgi:hypothetical protein